jgi:ribonuclease BN (tRNA processing enzyme)
MSRTVTVIGGSAASVGTGQGCASYLVSDSSTSIVLDAGPGTLQELRKHTDFRKLDAVVISHLHVDHMLDVIAMRFSLAYNPIKPERKTALWLPPGGKAFFQKLANVFAADGEPGDFFGGVFEVAEYDPNGTVEVGSFTLSFQPTVHFIPCWAIRIHTDDGDLVYTADTGPAANLGAFLEGSTVVIAEATTPEARKDTMPFEKRGHLTAREAATLAVEAGAETLVLTHMFEENDPSVALGEAADVFGGKLVHARPGTRISW